MNKDFNIENSNIDRNDLKKSTQVYFEQIYPSSDLQQKFNNLKDEFLNVFYNNDKELSFKLFLGNEQISSNFINFKSFAGPGGEIITETYLNKMDNVCNIVKEPNGDGTHPDFLINLNNNDILLEIKTIYCNEFGKDNNLLIKVNNATNSEGAVRSYLNEYKKYIKNNKFDINEFIKTHDIKNEARQFFETFVIFYYYYIDDEKPCINYFDIEIIPLPVVISFMLSDNGYLIYDKDNNVKLTVKSAGETSQNNNVNLALTLRQIFDKQSNLIIDPLMLYLLGHTYNNNNHIITNKELKRNKANQYINELILDLTNLKKSVTIEICQNNFDKIKIKYKYCSKNKHLLNDDIFEKYKIDYANVKKFYNKKTCLLEFIELNNKILNKTDKDLFKEFKKHYHKIKKFGINEYDDVYNEQKIKYRKIRG